MTVEPMRNPSWSDTQFRRLVESIRDYAIFMLDPQGRVVTWNAGAERIKGYTPDEIIGRHFSCFYEPADVASGKCERELEIAAREGRFEDEGWRVRKDGSRFWASVVINALRDESGELVGYAKVTRDLTERMEAEQERIRLARVGEANRIKDQWLARERAARDEAEDTRRWLATTLHSIGDAVLAIDSKGNITLMNPVAERLTGYRFEEARGHRLGEIFHVVSEETGQPLENPTERVLREGVVVALANHAILVRRDGTRTPIADSGAPIRDGAGRVHGVVLVFRDATEEKRKLDHERFLAEATATLSSSLDYRETLARVANLALPHLADWCQVHVVDQSSGSLEQVALAHGDPEKVRIAHELRQRTPTDPNAARGAPHVVRTGHSELYADVSDELIAAAAASPERAELLRALHLRSAVIVPLSTGAHVLGAITLAFAESNRRYEARDVPFFEELGRRAAIAIDNARLYSSEQRAREGADAANRSKDTFLATVSHELRTPLSAILGWARMLLRHPMEPAKQTRALESIERSAVAMAKLIEDLLDFSRIVSGKMRVEPRPVDLAEVVGNAIDAIGPGAEAKGIRIASSIERGDRPFIGDASRLQQIVWNLVNNAVKFTPPGGTVSVALRPAGESLELTVSDTGMGIDAGFLPHLFDPFRQAEDGVSRTSSGGLGLGLAIAKHLVALHGGTITAASDGPGRGSTFVVRLPMSYLTVGTAPKPSAPVRRARSALPPPRLDRLHVLVVEDDQDTRDLLREVLEQFGAKVTSAASASEAMTKMGNGHPPDVLLSDIGMPGESGYDLIRRVRALPANKGGNVAAAALTAYTRPEDRKNALEAGYTMHVPKPIDPAELARVVNSLAADRRPGSDPGLAR
ncbi:MAG TPA: PAS domain S-box protein [Polyangiaceae bacterium]|nr:PAS domain S-box protein [Polyangiaceae bacterium]